MRIPTDTEKISGAAPAAARPRRARWLFPPLVLVLAFLAGAWTYASAGFEFKDACVQALQKGPTLAVDFARGICSDPEQILLDIDHQDYALLLRMREEALAGDALTEDLRAFVPATVRHRGVRVRADVRLKGDWPDHWKGEQFSLRLRIKDGQAILGMRRFVLQHPRTRHYIYEWLYHRALAREDLLHVGYDFVDVIVNGRHLGIYALEEHFDMPLLAAQKRREGPIVHYPQEQRRVEGAESEWLTAQIDAFQSKRLATDETFRAQFQTARALLDGFRRGQLPASAVFDIDRMARYLAVTDLLGARHAAAHWNIRFYFNPVTARLEPIGYDATAGFVIDGVLGDQTWGYLLSSHIARMMADPALRTAYLRYLERVSAPGYLEALLREVAPELKAKLAILYRQFPWFRFAPERLEQNRRFIDRVLRPELPADAYLARVTPGPSATLEIDAANRRWIYPLEIEGLDLAGQAIPPVPGQDLVLPARDRQRPPAFRRCRFALSGPPPEPAALAGLRLRYRISGLDEVRSIAVLPWPPEIPAAVQGEPPWAAAPATLPPWIEAAPDGATWRIRPGAWRLESDLVLPAGIALECGPDTSIDLARGAAMLARGPLRWIGQQGGRIRLHSSDGTGQGLAVMSAGEPSRLEWVDFDGLAAPEREHWRLTGAVSFYQSGVRLLDCRFRDIRGEDALNPIRCRFELRRCTFERTKSDALDADFCTGAIHDSRFEDCGNDAVDCSDSEIEIDGLSVAGALDKGISAGERSTVGARRVSIAGAAVGVASKDGSKVQVADLKLASCRAGLAVYRKKGEFPGGQLEATGVARDPASATDLVEVGSALTVDGRTVRGHRRGVAAQLEGGGP